jgi:hypothetical protein
VEMINGRPSQDLFCSYFFNNGTINFDELQNRIDVSGCHYFSGKVRDGLCHGEGKQWLSNGRIFIGVFQFDKMLQGNMYEID